MGYPMDYSRFVSRNDLLRGGYSISGTNSPLDLIRGDLRRMETDQRDKWHLASYAAVAGITSEQAKAVLDSFFSGSAVLDACMRRATGNSGDQS